jgi:septal ring factor EnvC (AmiA/AmiB activator)
MKVAAVVALALFALGSANHVSPVQKVIQLIDDMATKVKKDLDETNLSFESFAKECDDQAAEKDFAIKNSQEEIEALQASIDDSAAKISSLESKVDELSTNIAGAEGEHAKAISLREKEHADFVATEKSMLETIGSLNGALTELKKSVGLVQMTPSARRGLNTVVESLGKIVEANFVTHEQRDKVRAFLQAQEDAEDSLTIRSSDGGGNAIIETLEEMTDKAEGTLSRTRKAEMEAAHAHTMLVQGIENEIKSFKEEMSESTKSKAFNQESKASSEKDLAVEKKGLSEDSNFLKDLKNDCQQRATEFEAESRDANAELTALGKAKGILTKKFGALVQTKQAVKMMVHDDEDARAQALRHIQNLGKKFHSTMLVALAYRASADPFSKVRSMIEDMIAKLLQEAAEEATQKAFCDEEIGKSKKSQAEKEESLDKTNTRIAKGESSVAKLSELVATLSKEIAEIDASVAESTAIRNKEKAGFLVVEKDMSESEEACAAAISVLREYYEGASLVQVNTNSKSLAKGDGSGILGVLEIAESDFAKLLAEARSTEEAAASEYEKMMQENKLLKATKEVDVKGKQSEVKSLQTALADYNEDKEGTTGELNAVLDYLDKLKPQCETKAPTYAEKKAAREAEIQGLKEALDILAGDGVAASFVQLSHKDGPMETIGNTAGAVGGGVGDATGPVTGPVGDAAGGAVTTVGDGAGGAAGSVAGENPMEKVPLVGGAFKVTAVSTALNCVVSLTIQYFVVYTALALCRTAADVWNLKYESVPIQKILQTAAITVNYAPMLAVLLLAVRMRVTWLTQGKGNPQVWVQMWMYCATYAVLLMTLIVVVIPLFTGEIVGVNSKTGDLEEDAKPFENFILAGCFTVLKYFIMIGLYIGVICIIYGACTFVPPAGTWPGDKIPPPAPAVACTMIMACMYFLVYAGVQFSRTWTQFTGSKFTKFENSMMIAANAMNFAPMLSVLFIGARMRALQMDPVNGAPQKWAQNCFFMCTYATLAQVLISIAVTLVLSGTADTKQKVEGDVVFKVENKALGAILTVGRYLIMFCIYVGFSCVIYSIFTIEHPNGPQYTPPISVTMQCVINLTFQFFFIYLMIFICVTIDEFTGMKWQLLINTMENMKGTVAYCPMLAILFVGTRMRALLITNNKGAPQGWAQDGMYMATWAVLIQFLFGLLVPLCTGTATPCDEDGTPEYKPANPIALYCVLALKWVTYIFLYGGVIAVVTAVYTMTPETANGRGSVPLVGDYVGEPVGVNDIPNPTF